MTDKLASLIARNVKRTVYHYTNCEAFLSIVKNEKIWATHINYLNDESEYNLAKNLFLKKINTKAKHNTTLRDKLPEIKKHIESCSNTMDIYVASFTTKQDDLNQWRTYGSSTPSFSIGIDTRNFKNVLSGKKDIQDICDIVSGTSLEQSNENILFLPCFYYEEPMWFTLFDDIIDAFEKAESPEDYSRAAKQFNYYAPLIKNGKFKDEEEWRLIIYIRKRPVIDKIIHQEKK